MCLDSGGSFICSSGDREHAAEAMIPGEGWNELSLPHGQRRGLCREYLVSICEFYHQVIGTSSQGWEQSRSVVLTAVSNPDPNPGCSPELTD